MHILKQLKTNFTNFLYSSFEKSGLEGISDKENNTESSENSTIEQQKIESLKQELEDIKGSKSFVGGIENNLKTRLLRDGDPKDTEYQKLAQKVKSYQEELKMLSGKEEGIQSQLQKLLQEIKSEIQKVSLVEVENLKTISNREFLDVPRKNRLQYVTKNNIDSKQISSGKINSIEITFDKDGDGKINKELYMKTTAGQVLPNEVREVNIGSESYKRDGLKGEFFNKNNKRLTIHEGTKLELVIGDITKLEKNNSDKISSYLEFNKGNNAYSDLISESVSRGIDIGFALLVFGDKINDLGFLSSDRSIQIEEMFTQFDRVRGDIDMWDGKKMENGKYPDELVVKLLNEFNGDNVKDKAKEYGISDDSLKNNMMKTSSNFKNIDLNNLPTGVNGLLEFISIAEGTLGNYNAIYANAGQSMVDFTDMSLEEVLYYQGKYKKKNGSAAIGKYQFMDYTLKDIIKNHNISIKQKFTPEFQDKIAIIQLEKRGLNEYLYGNGNKDEFQKKLSKEWASFPKDASGKSYYDGDKMGNHALVSNTQMDIILDKIKV